MSAFCSCCARIFENGKRRPPTQALYQWQTPTGYWFPLCAACCTIWRANAVTDPELAPTEVRSIRAASRAPSCGHLLG